MNPDQDDRIRRRAYELWEREGAPEGRHLDHWAAAALEIGDDEPVAAPGPEGAARLDPPAARGRARPKKTAAKSPMADAGSPGGTAGTGGTFRDQ